MSECQFCECDCGKRQLAHWRLKEDERETQRLQALFRNAGIPAHFRDMSIASLIARAGGDTGKFPAIAAVSAFIANGYATDPATQRYKPGLVLSGTYGCGKTGLLTPALQHYLSQGKSGLWIEVYDLLSEIQQGYTDGDSAAKLTAAQQADAILLDDLGDPERDKPETDDRRKLIYQLINYRHNRGLTMMITTNCSQPQLEIQFGKRTVERIIESCAWITMSGRNLRRE